MTTAPATVAADEAIIVPIGCFWQEDPIQLRMVRVWKTIRCTTEQRAAFTRDLYDVTPETEAMYQRWLDGDETAVLEGDGEAEDDPEQIVRSLADRERREAAKRREATSADVIAQRVARAVPAEDVRRVLAWAITAAVPGTIGVSAPGRAVQLPLREERRQTSGGARMTVTPATREAVNGAFAQCVQLQRGYVELEDCTADDLDWLADQHAARAYGELTLVVRYRRLARTVREYGAERVADLPDSVRAGAYLPVPERADLMLEVQQEAGE